jgi:enoyl-CoA hydratase/carnithine racemase
MMSSVLIEKREPVALVTLNRPEKLNALDYPTIDRLLGVLDELELDDAVRAVILTGAGDRAFCAGADIQGFAPSVWRGQETALREFVRRGQRLTSRIETFPKPIIVAVNGLAHGAGCEITEAAPLAIASERAEFCKAEINLGFAPPFGGSQRLPRHVGRKRALYMILTADRVPLERPNPTASSTSSPHTNSCWIRPCCSRGRSPRSLRSRSRPVWGASRGD